MNFDQNIFNIGIGTLGALLGWWLNAIWQSVKELQAADIKLAEKVNEIEVLVAGSYVKNDRFQSMEAALFAKLDRIEDKLDKKADKCP